MDCFYRVRLTDEPCAYVLQTQATALASKNRPLSVHDMRGAILPAEPVRKLSAQINVELMVGWKVFGQHADRSASPPQRAGRCGHDSDYQNGFTERALLFVLHCLGRAIM